MRGLIAAFGGEVPEEAYWAEIIRIANLGWLVPALHIALKTNGNLSDLPEEVRSYLELLHDRNLARNRRLHSQLIEAIGALNAAGIHPILLKGAIQLFTADEEDLGGRMLSDLDINIEPSQMDEAKAALATLGYRAGSIPRELHRPDDAAELELHDRPSRRSAGYYPGPLWDTTALVQRHGVTAGVPDATSQALHLIVHDMIKEGDYWRLRIDLRHLHDLARLAAAPEGLDWDRLKQALSSGEGRGALALQALALSDLYGIMVPPDVISSAVLKLKHKLRLAASERTVSGRASRAIGNVHWGIHRLADDKSSKTAVSLAKRAYGVFVRPATGSRI